MITNDFEYIIVNKFANEIDKKKDFGEKNVHGIRYQYPCCICGVLLTVRRSDKLRMHCGDKYCEEEYKKEYPGKTITFKDYPDHLAKMFPKPPPNTICVVCGKEFRAHPSWLVRTKNPACSKECREERDRQKTMRKCKHCKKMFSYREEGYHPHGGPEKTPVRFCSEECHRRHYYIVIKCDTCGKDFERLRSQHTSMVKRKNSPNGKFFCSRECFNKHSAEVLKAVGWGSKEAISRRAKIRHEKIKVVRKAILENNNRATIHEICNWVEENHVKIVSPDYAVMASRLRRFAKDGLVMKWHQGQGHRLYFSVPTKEDHAANTRED